ncbi:MAG: hypothetical protein GY861_28750 [bacterium]|nr:hypothetical protein [bacterium]
MAHTGIFATSAECIFKMGNGYDSTNVDEDRINELCSQVEGFCCALARYDFATNWAALDAVTKTLLTEIESNYVGYYGAMYAAAGYGSQREQENIINTCWARFVQCIGLLKDQKTVTEIKP